MEIVFQKMTLKKNTVLKSIIEEILHVLMMIIKQLLEVLLLEDYKIKHNVFPLEKNDFVRTRLTHSIETSAIAKKLGNMVLANISLEKNKNNNSYKDYQKNKEEMSTIPDLLACAGLIHDIGNPPFGHFGEVVMSDWFKDNIKHLKYKGKQLEDVLTKQQLEDLYHLDGNAQALRVVGKLHDLHNESGMNLTKSLLNILVKYPV